MSFNPGLPVSASNPLPVQNGASFTLASNVTVGANGGTTQVDGISGGSFIFDAQFIGTSIMLQSLGADGMTWRNGPTLTTSGSTGVIIGAGASVRVFNPNGTGLTGVYASLS